MGHIANYDDKSKIGKVTNVYLKKNDKKETPLNAYLVYRQLVL